MPDAVIKRPLPLAVFITCFQLLPTGDTSRDLLSPAYVIADSYYLLLHADIVAHLSRLIHMQTRRLSGVSEIVTTLREAQKEVTIDPRQVRVLR